MQPFPTQPAYPMPTRRASLRDTPVSIWVGLAIGVLAFAVKIETRTISTFGGYSCSYTNYAGYLACASIVVCLGTAWTRWARTRADFRIPAPLMVAATAVLVALSVVHALRGTGSIQNPCDAHPLP